MTIKFKEPLAPNYQIQLDWRGYFYEFCRAHGNTPVPYPYHPPLPSPRLLFSDGWTYSATDYKGPEYPPPTDPRELKELLLTYWITRYKVLNSESNNLRGSIVNLKALQSLKSAPLQQVSRHFDPDLGKLVQKKTTIDFDGMQIHLELLEQNLSEAEIKIRELHNADPK